MRVMKPRLRRQCSDFHLSIQIPPTTPMRFYLKSSRLLKPDRLGSIKRITIILLVRVSARFCARMSAVDSPSHLQHTSTAARPRHAAFAERSIKKIKPPRDSSSFFNLMCDNFLSNRTIYAVFTEMDC